jgi:hypothetical protein
MGGCRLRQEDCRAALKEGFAATWALWNVLQESMEWACLFLHAMQKVLRVSI